MVSGAQWYLRSTADQDTHRGQLLAAEGVVEAACGARFTPLPLPGDRLALPCHPMDADQICLHCKEAR